jgi:hypothetical protein
LPADVIREADDVAGESARLWATVGFYLFGELKFRNRPGHAQLTERNLSCRRNGSVGFLVVEKRKGQERSCP